MAWITTVDSNRRDDRGRPIKPYRVGWHEIAPRRRRQTDPALPEPARQSAQAGTASRDVRHPRGRTGSVDEINPKIARGQSPTAQRDVGNRPLSHYAQAWLDGVASKVKPRVLADYRANYRRYVAEPLGDKAVATINAADVRSFRAALMAPRPRPTHMRPKGIVDASAELVTLSRSTVKHATDTPRRILDVAVVDGAITANRERRYQYPSDRHPR